MSVQFEPHSRRGWLCAGLDVHALKAINAALDNEDHPTPQAAQRIADHTGTDAAGHAQQMMGHRQRRKTLGYGRGLEPARLAILDISYEPRFARGQTDPGLPRHKARITGEIDRERLDGGQRPRLEALAEMEFDQSGPLPRQVVEQGDELGFALLGGTGLTLGQRGLARREDRHDLTGSREVRHWEVWPPRGCWQGGFGAYQRDSSAKIPMSLSIILHYR